LSANRISILLFLLFCFFNLTVQAIPDPTNIDDGKPIEIRSDSAEFDDKKGTAKYTGNVVMKQGTRQLHAHTLLIKKDPSGKIESMIAKGEPAYFYSKLNTPKKPTEGRAKTIQYFPKLDKLILLENAELTQDPNTIQGESLVYFISTHILSSEPVAGKRTMVILPQRNKSSPTEK
jgi:lipopolysaccharide export system protein LptA